MSETLIITIIVGVIIAGIISLIPIMIVLSRITPYAYVSARLKTMKSKMLSEQDFINLSSRPYEDVLKVLDNTIYPNLALSTKGNLSFSSVETLIRSELIKELEKIKRISPEQEKKFVQAILSKYDIQVIEHIVRSTTKKNKTKTDILHHTKLFSKEFVNKKDHTLEELRKEIKSTVYEKILNKHISEIKNGNFEAFEYELDKHYFKQLLSASKSEEQKKYVKLLIDLQNISQAFKNQKQFVSGGNIRVSQITTPLDVEKAKKLLEKININSQAKTKQGVEKDMQLALKKYGESLIKKDPHSSNIITGYIILSSIHNRNIVTLLKMTQDKFPSEEILKVLAI